MDTAEPEDPQRKRFVSIRDPLVIGGLIGSMAFFLGLQSLDPTAPRALKWWAIPVVILAVPFFVVALWRWLAPLPVISPVDPASLRLDGIQACPNAPPVQEVAPAITPKQRLKHSLSIQYPLIIGSLILGPALFFGFALSDEFRYSTNMDAAPQPIACRALLAGGARGNDYVILTHFRVSDGTYVREVSHSGGGRTWIRLQPDDAGVAPSDILVLSTPLQSTVQFREVEQQGQLEGMVTVGPPTTLDARALQIISPDVASSRWLVLTHGKTPPSSRTVYGLALCILGSVVASLPFFVVAIRRWRAPVGDVPDAAAT